MAVDNSSIELFLKSMGMLQQQAQASEENKLRAMEIEQRAKDRRMQLKNQAAELSIKAIQASADLAATAQGIRKSQADIDNMKEDQRLAIKADERAERKTDADIKYTETETEAARARTEASNRAKLGETVTAYKSLHGIAQEDEAQARGYQELANGAALNANLYNIIPGATPITDDKGNVIDYAIDADPSGGKGIRSDSGIYGNQFQRPREFYSHINGSVSMHLQNMEGGATRENVETAIAYQLVMDKLSSMARGSRREQQDYAAIMRGLEGIDENDVKGRLGHILSRMEVTYKNGKLGFMTSSMGYDSTKSDKNIRMAVNGSFEYLLAGQGLAVLGEQLEYRDKAEELRERAQKGNIAASALLQTAFMDTAGKNARLAKELGIKFDKDGNPYMDDEQDPAPPKENGPKEIPAKLGAATGGNDGGSEYPNNDPDLDGDLVVDDRLVSEGEESFAYMPGMAEAGSRKLGLSASTGSEESAVADNGISGGIREIVNNFTARRSLSEEERSSTLKNIGSLRRRSSEDNERIASERERRAKVGDLKYLTDHGAWVNANVKGIYSDSEIEEMVVDRIIDNWKHRAPIGSVPTRRAAKARYMEAIENAKPGKTRKETIFNILMYIENLSA